MNDCKSLNCSFCSYPKKTYLETVSEKDEYLKRLYANNKNEFLPFVAMEEPYNYRHKVIASFQMIKGKVQAGLYEEKSHKLIVNEGCRLQTNSANDIIVSIVDLANQFKLEVYNEDRQRGLLRHVQLRVGYRSNEVLVTLVLGNKIFKSRQNFIKALIKKHPNITSVVCNYNQRKTSVVLGSEELVSYGPGFIYDRIDNYKFKISSQSFYQVNPIQTEKLYTEALKLADIREGDLVLDAYSGIGTLTLLASSKAKKVIGVEINKSAVSDAKRNASINGVSNVEFILADASDFMQKYQRVVDVLLMDPTRNGSDDRFLSAALKLKPRKIVYISCGPSTQLRDIKHLLSDYKITAIRGFDMFPFTDHAETVCLLSKLKSNHHIEVNLNMDELDLTSAESKATYEEIKDYVLENSGFKVSSLYIGQVKEKMGIKERENYNISKKEDAKVPKCPADKEKAIVAALKHFNMIE